MASLSALKILQVLVFLNRKLCWLVGEFGLLHAGLAWGSGDHGVLSWGRACWGVGVVLSEPANVCHWRCCSDYIFITFFFILYLILYWFFRQLDCFSSLGTVISSDAQ